MRDLDARDLKRWVVEAGLAGLGETALVSGFCERLVEAGLALARGTAVMDTLHPVHEGRAVRWRGGDPDTDLVEYGRTNQGGEAEELWRRSPFFHLVEHNRTVMRRRLDSGVDAADEPDFPVFAELRAEGITEYLALVTRFAADGVIGEMDCMYSAWMTEKPGGFSDSDVAALQELVPLLALALKCRALMRIAGTLVETYLGRDAGRLVLSGRIERGVADKIPAVLWFSDLRGYTTITDTSPAREVIPLLNDYAEAVISAIHAQGGDVLKLIGDGILAIFRIGADPEESCRRAIAAATTVQHSVAALNERRGAAGLPTTQVYLGLHIGEVFYGNIGSLERLDFTVVGPAVNEVSRIASMCRSAERTILVSTGFAAAAGAERDRLVSVGRYALRGVRRPQELFTLEPYG
jgi:adenylate cyclase